MTEQQAEWGIQALYENSSARDELTDEEAKTLLKWGEDQVMRLAAMDLDESTFEAAFDKLSGLIRRMNRLAARGPDMDPQARDQALNRIAEYAHGIGLKVQPPALDQFSAQALKPDIHENVHRLIGLVSDDQTDPDAPHEA